MARRYRAIACFLLVLLVGAGMPLIERWVECRQPLSEACVWAKAYLPLSFAVWGGVGVVAALVLWFLLGRRDGK